MRFQNGTGWVRVTKGSPCPICHKHDWCTIAPDGTGACCMRTESGRRLGNGGWFHKLGRDLLGASARAAPPMPRRYLSADTLGDTWARWALGTSDEQIAGLAKRLGVKPESLRAVGVCWAWPHEAWAFPMYDGEENFAGIRLRSDEGDKWALRGSHQGIFIPYIENQADVLIVEGPTDAAAAVSLGFYAIGRPSCSGGACEILQWCKRHSIRRVSVLADNDSPGLAGARTLCGQLDIPARLVVLPAKDLREWVQNGATRQAVEACINNHIWNRRT